MVSKSVICGASLGRVVFFNRALALQNENHEIGNKHLPYAKMTAWLVGWKKASETQWLKEAPSQPLQQVLKDLDRAYKHFFQKRASFPRFKIRGQSDAFRYPQGVKLNQKNNRISLPKLGWISYRNSREVVGEVKNVTISQVCGMSASRRNTKYLNLNMNQHQWLGWMPESQNSRRSLMALFLNL